MSDWLGPFPNDDDINARMLAYGWRRSADMLGAIASGRGQAPATITMEDLRRAMDQCMNGAQLRAAIEVSAAEWEALTALEPKDWPRAYGLPSDLGGVRVVVVGIEDARRRQAEMEDLLD